MVSEQDAEVRGQGIEEVVSHEEGAAGVEALWRHLEVILHQRINP